MHHWNAEMEKVNQVRARHEMVEGKWSESAYDQGTSSHLGINDHLYRYPAAE